LPIINLLPNLPNEARSAPWPNPIAYYATEFIAAVKIFIAKATEGTLNSTKFGTSATSFVAFVQGDQKIGKNFAHFFKK
jgi:hypothetical protein